MFTIARLTFLEVFRKKVFSITVLLSVLFLFLYGVALDYTAQEMLRLKALQDGDLLVQQIIGNQLLGMGLYFSSFLIALLALMASVGAISSEIENGLLHAIVSKPILRREIILGKLLGYGVMLAVYAVFLYAAILLLNWHYTPGVFSLSSAGNILSGALIFILQPILLLSLAMVFSTLLRTMTAGILSIILYGLGMVGGFLEQLGSAINNITLINIGIGSSLLMPSDALFRMLIAEVTGNAANPLAILSMGPFGVSTPPSNAMLVYVILYILVCILLSLRFFGQKDL
ncbi:ABC transporter permease subunit [Desulforamulus ferrireducens]|uniref:ABC transporter permease n=1 Tax=Desulforamulus ferrireducens TaxID=1833852 RepID=A0A1S6IW29_9FIRM|nr:ABC transporter permease subunit [Desulforamulus ferrireducens]AQS58983.1 ABC transporter permease [Desulforamulus ferrireducens]